MKTPFIDIRSMNLAAFRHTAVALFLVALSAGVQARALFEQPDADFKGRIRAREAAHPGSTVTLNGSGFNPGQQIELLNNGQPITTEKTVEADDKGEFKAKVKVPASASAGLHPVVIQTRKPVAADVFAFKVSPVVPLSGADQVEVKTARLNPGLYQVAYSPKNAVLFVTASVGRRPVKESTLMKVDPESLKITASITPADDSEDDRGQVQAVYGVGVDDEDQTVWATNTRSNTVAVYRQEDLSLVKQFPNGIAPHARDVVVDTKNDRAYVSASGDNFIAVFDTAKMAQIGQIALKTTRRTPERPKPMSLALDADNGKLYTVSGVTREAYVIDLKNQAVERVIDLPGSRDPIGVAVEPAGQRLFVAGQDSDNLLIVDLKDGSVKHDVTVGATPLNVRWEPVKKLAWVTSRADGTVAAVNAEGRLVANLKAGPLANHLTTDGKGNVFVVNKAGRPDDEEGDHLSRYTMK